MEVAEQVTMGLRGGLVVDLLNKLGLPGESLLGDGHDLAHVTVVPEHELVVGVQPHVPRVLALMENILNQEDGRCIQVMAAHLEDLGHAAVGNSMEVIVHHDRRDVMASFFISLGLE